MSITKRVLLLQSMRPTGLMISILEGDTIEVLHNTYPERVRLRGDCPEKGQAFGTRAKQAASALVFGRDVMLDTHGQARPVLVVS